MAMCQTQARRGIDNIAKGSGCKLRTGVGKAHSSTMVGWASPPSNTNQTYCDMYP
jgi:hypothetical protein